ncbi:MAG TPA: ABC transporter ATP-binding protein [Lachnospiraceae bacterium]|nr:ABC transporter ATP-binding protein [Lachnospiraceae bacterium]
MLKGIGYIFNKKQKLRLVFLFFVILVGTGLELLGVSAILPLVEVVMDPSAIDENRYLSFVKELLGIQSVAGFVLFMALCLIVVYIVKNVYLIYMNNALISFTKSCQVYLATKIMNVYVRQSYLFHVIHNTAELQRNISLDVSQFVQFVSAGLQLLTEASVCVVLIGFLIRQDVVTTLSVAAILLIFILVAASWLRRILGDLGEKARVAGARGTQISLQIFNGIKDIKVFNREGYFLKSYEDYAVYEARLQRKQQLYNYLPKPIMESVCICSLLVTLSFRIYYGSAEELMSFVPTLSVFAIAAFRMLPSFNRITGYMGTLSYAKASVNALYEDLRQIEELERAEKQRNIPGELTFEDKVEIRNVSFRYPESERPVFEAVNIILKKNTSIALIGPSGAGKTTLADVVLGVLTPSTGSIYLDGTDIYSHLDEWHRMTGYIPQEIYLLDDTILKNIAFGIDEQEINTEEVKRAAREAQLEEFIETLPEGYETRVGERGVMLSGGQRQRIGIARALYHNPSVLVLDEATSALDNATEAAVMEAINSFQGNKTLIVIAHRLSTIRSCDLIYEVNEGSVSLKRPGEVFKDQEPAGL